MKVSNNVAKKINVQSFLEKGDDVGMLEELEDIPSKMLKNTGENCNSGLQLLIEILQGDDNTANPYVAIKVQVVWFVSNHYVSYKLELF